MELIDLTNVSESDNSSFSFSVVDLTKPAEDRWILSIDIGLVNMALCWFEPSSSEITRLELIKVADSSASNAEIAKKVGSLVDTWLCNHSLSLVIIEKQIQHITQKRFGYSKAGTQNIVIEASLVASFSCRGIETLEVDPGTVAAQFSLPKDRASKKNQAVSLIKSLFHHPDESNLSNLP